MKENKQILWISLFLLGIIAVLILTFIYLEKRNTIDYEGIKFKKIKTSDVSFYTTNFQTKIQGKFVDYNVFLRNNPNDLSKIPFEGKIFLKDPLAINLKNNTFDCSKDEVISLANLIQIFGAIGINTIIDENTECTEDYNYSYLEIVPGQTTKIVQTGTTCYKLYINECEILPGTERFILEALKVIKDSQ